jgi:putative transposase
LCLQRGLLRWRRIELVCGTAVDSFHGIHYKTVMEMKQQLKTLYHCVYSLHFHLVLVTKYRRKCLTPAMRDHVKGTAAALLEKWGGSLIECNGEADHMHLLLEVSPIIQLSTLVNNLKTVTSRLLRRDHAQELAHWYRQPVLWSRSYCVLSCGGAPLSVLRQYIEQQGDTEP